MTDAPESPRRRPTNTQTASHLQYPTLPPLTASVEEWLSRSRPTNMTSDRLMDNPKTLSESWATLSVSDLHSEDGSRSEQTDAGSLIDQTSPDDVASLDGRYSNSDVDGQDHPADDEADDKDEAQSTVSAMPDVFAHGAAIDDSNLTTRPAFATLDSIEFVEPEKWPEIERVELKHTIRVFDGAAASELKGRLPYNSTDSILTATVQQTMTKQSLDLNKPFRVLYIGQPEFRNIILDKIGDVLVSSSNAGSEPSSTESSRYHVVPTSFGAGAVPNFAELLPIHVQLVVDECVDATADPRADRPNTLHLNFKNRPSCISSWTGSEYRISSASEWTLPDVAILFVSGRDDAAAVRTRRIVHTFLEHHGIPAMVISEDPLLNMVGEIIPLNQDSLHMCLESRHPQTSETAVLRRYPIDIKTFESITPGQLNRNLASLVGLYPKKTNKIPSDPPGSLDWHTFIDPEKYPRDWIPPSYATRARELAPILRLVTLTFVSAIAFAIGYAIFQAVTLFLVQWMAGSAISNIFAPATHQESPASILTLDRVGQASLSIQPPAHVQPLDVQPSGCSTIKESMGLIASSAGSEPDNFEIQVVGDCHVVIKPPQSFVSSKKQPRFNVGVSRHNQALPHELSRLFDGVYTLKLDREDAWGLVNVTIVAKSRPPLNQTMAIDFGTPWLKIANWRRAAQAVSSQLARDLQTAQTGLTEVYGRLSTDLQVIVGDVVRRSHFLRRDAERFRRESLHARDNVLSRSKQLSEVFAHTAVQRFRTTSSVLYSRSSRVNQEVKGFVSHAWSRLGKSAVKVDLRAMMDRVRHAHKCEVLDRAQARARHVLGRRACGNSEDCSARGHSG